MRRWLPSCHKRASLLPAARPTRDPPLSPDVVPKSPNPRLVLISRKPDLGSGWGLAAQSATSAGVRAGSVGDARASSRSRTEYPAQNRPTSATGTT